MQSKRPLFRSVESHVCPEDNSGPLEEVRQQASGSTSDSKGSSKAVSNVPLPAEVLAPLVPKCAFEAQVVAAA